MKEKYLLGYWFQWFPRRTTFVKVSTVSYFLVWMRLRMPEFENITDIENRQLYFIRNIVDASFMNQLFAEHQFDRVLHLAAESHVDRSITDPFVKTNVIGTMNLLNAINDLARAIMERNVFTIGTDGVYGSLKGLFTETTSPKEFGSCSSVW
jgi:dTDP-D-glucose 4,6-dehydratase